MAELSYAEILEKLHNNTIEWEAFQSKTLLPTPSFEERVTLELPGILKQNFQKKTFLCSPGKKEGVEQEEICLVRIKIVFQPVGAGVKKERAFTYKAVVVRGGTAKNNALKKEGGVW